MICVTLNMPSAAEECRELSGNRQGISRCLESGHPVWLWMFCAVSKQINDKERAAAALENPNLLSLVNECISDAEYRWQIENVHMCIRTCGVAGLHGTPWTLTVVPGWVLSAGLNHFCATCTGCASLNASSFVWPFLCSAVATRLHRTTWWETYSGQTRTTRGDDCDRRQLRSCSCVAHDYERSATALSALLHRTSGTTCLLTSFLHRHWPFSNGAWRLICLDSHSADNWPCYLSLKLCLRQDKYCR